MSILLTRLSRILAGAGGGSEWLTHGSSRRIRRILLGVLVTLLAGLAAPTHARAATNGIAVGVFPEFPTRVDVGATNVAASIYVVNGSSGAEGVGPVTVTDLTLVPSCGNFSPTCAGGADRGVLVPSATGTGAAPTSCAGKAFDLTVVDASTGRLRITPSDGSAFTLGASDIASDLDTCRIRFTMSAPRLPNIDSYPNLAEPQTNQVASLSVRHGNGSTGSDGGEDVTTLVGTPEVPAERYARWLDRAFRDLLGRGPNTAESDYWVDTLVAGQHTRASLANLITVSTEYRRHMIGKYFTSYLGRAATDRELSSHVDLLAGGWSFQFCEGHILSGDEFFARQGSTLRGYVEALYRMVLGRTPDPAGVDYLVDQMTRGASRFSVAVAFTTYPAAHDRMVTAASQWLLRRAPTAAELTTWSDQLDDGLRQEAFYAGLVASEEYWSQV